MLLEKRYLVLALNMELQYAYVMGINRIILRSHYFKGNLTPNWKALFVLNTS